MNMKMPRKKTGPGKRQLKKMTRERILSEYQAQGFVVEEQTAGSITYQVVKFPDEDKQVVAAVYGSLNQCASIWMKEPAFAIVGPTLPDDAVVEDVDPFRRGFQWAIHIEGPESTLIPKIIQATVDAGRDRLSKTLKRREADARRDRERADRLAKKAASRRDWKKVVSGSDEK